MLNTLVEEGLISEYMFLFIPETTSDLQGSKQVLHGHVLKIMPSMFSALRGDGRNDIVLRL